MPNKKLSAIKRLSDADKKDIIANVMRNYEKQKSIFSENDLITEETRRSPLEMQWMSITTYLSNSDNRIHLLFDLLTKDIEDAIAMLPDSTKDTVADKKENLVDTNAKEISKIPLCFAFHKGQLAKVSVDEMKKVLSEIREMNDDYCSQRSFASFRLLNLIKPIAKDEDEIKKQWQALLAYGENENNQTEEVYLRCKNYIRDTVSDKHYMEMIKNTHERAENYSFFKKSIAQGAVIGAMPAYIGALAIPACYIFVEISIPIFLVGVALSIPGVTIGFVAGVMHGAFQTITRHKLLTLEQQDALISKLDDYAGDDQAQKDIIANIIKRYEESSRNSSSNSQNLYETLKGSLSLESKWKAIIDYVVAPDSGFLNNPESINNGKKLFQIINEEVSDYPPVNYNDNKSNASFTM